jgi:hypothetical protein
MSNLPVIKDGIIIESGNSLKDIIIDGIETVWDFIDNTAYWVCAVTGVFYLIVYIATKDGRFKTRALIAVLTYLLIAIIGYVI